MTCEQWLARDFYRRAGYRFAVKGDLRWSIDGPCGHDLRDCPPIEEATEERPVLAA